MLGNAIIILLCRQKHFSIDCHSTGDIYFGNIIIIDYQNISLTNAQFKNVNINFSLDCH